MERNLNILKGRLWSPTRSCLKISGPGELILTARATMSIGMENSMIRRIDPTISVRRFMKRLKDTERGMVLTWITGRPSTSSV